MNTLMSRGSWMVCPGWLAPYPSGHRAWRGRPQNQNPRAWHLGTARRQVAATEHSVTTLLPSPFIQRQSVLGTRWRAGTRDPGEQDRQSPPLGVFTLLTMRVTHEYVSVRAVKQDEEEPWCKEGASRAPLRKSHLSWDQRDEKEAGTWKAGEPAGKYLGYCK